MKKFMKHAMPLLLVVCLVTALGCSAFAAISSSAFAANSNWVKSPFVDVSEEAWYYEWVEAAYNLDLMQGTGTDPNRPVFEPNTPTNRAMFVTILYRFYRENADPNETYPNAGFVDVPANAWYTEAVNWAVDFGITQGIDATHFNPTGLITREQAATFAFRAASNINSTITSTNQVIDWDNGQRADLSGYPDLGQVSGYATEAFQWAVANEIITGTTSNNGTILNPHGQATRAQVAKILVGFELHIYQVLGLI